MTMGGSQFCFSIVIVVDSVHEGATPEQVTLSPISASTPDLLAPPVPSVTIVIIDSDGEYCITVMISTWHATATHLNGSALVVGIKHGQI